VQDFLEGEGHLLLLGSHVEITFPATAERIVAILNDGRVRQVNGLRIVVGIFILCF
jgi:hypothetical protein